MERISNVLLIDDDFASNFLHKIFLQRIEIIDKIHTANNGKHALEVLFDANLKPIIVPELIFLDINMPIMDGWEFLEKYQNIVDTAQSKIIMVSASANPIDEKKAKANPFVFHYETKPLNEKKILMILDLINLNNVEKQKAAS